MKAKPSKQPKPAKPAVLLKDLKAKKDAKGGDAGLRNLVTTLSMDLGRPK